MTQAFPQGTGEGGACLLQPGQGAPLWERGLWWPLGHWHFTTLHSMRCFHGKSHQGRLEPQHLLVLRKCLFRGSPLFPDSLDPAGRRGDYLPEAEGPGPPSGSGESAGEELATHAPGPCRPQLPPFPFGEPGHAHLPPPEAQGMSS